MLHPVNWVYSICSGLTASETFENEVHSKKTCYLQCKRFSHFKFYNIYIFKFNKVLTKDIINFEQLVPDV